MRRLIDSLICILVTICMFAMPMLLLGLAPWIGDSLMTFTHITARRGFLAGIGLILLMMIGAGGLLMVIIPAFAAVYWPLVRLSRFGTRFLSGAIVPRRNIDADPGPQVISRAVPRRPAPAEPTTGQTTAASVRSGGARVHREKQPPIASITPRGSRPPR
jgi:hypothetical protein